MLFENTKEPLAITLRPKTFEEVVGQKKIISILQKIKNPISMILYACIYGYKTLFFNNILFVNSKTASLTFIVFIR